MVFNHIRGDPAPEDFTSRRVEDRTTEQMVQKRFDIEHPAGLEAFQDPVQKWPLETNRLRYVPNNMAFEIVLDGSDRTQGATIFISDHVLDQGL